MLFITLPPILYTAPIRLEPVDTIQTGSCCTRWMWAFMLVTESVTQWPSNKGQGPMIIWTQTVSLSNGPNVVCLTPLWEYLVLIWQLVSQVALAVHGRYIFHVITKCCSSCLCITDGHWWLIALSCWCLWVLHWSHVGYWLRGKWSTGPVLGKRKKHSGTDNMS